MTPTIPENKKKVRTGLDIDGVIIMNSSRELRKRLTEYAEERGISFSYVLRLALEEYLNKNQSL